MDTKKTYLVSPGGSGCTFLYNVFGEAFLKGNYEFHNVHQRFPQVKDPANTRILYVMAHPVNILLSIAKRFWKPEIWIYHIRMIQGDINGLYNITEPCDGGEKPTLRKYAKQGLNLYDFAGHCETWGRYCDSYGIENLFARYEDLPERMNEIADFVKKDPSPYQFIPRKSDFATHGNRDLMKVLAKIHFADIENWLSYATKEQTYG